MKTDDETILFKCDCGEFSFLEVFYDTDFYYFTITYYPKTFIGKIKAIFAIIKGSRFGASEEIVLRPKDAKELSKFLNRK